VNINLLYTSSIDTSKNCLTDFSNWNRVMVRYCDGSAFTGDVEEVDAVCWFQYVGLLKCFSLEHISA
jgi:hypothetical protein